MPAMHRGRRICEALHLLALGVWLGSLILAGAVAAQLFPMLRSLDPSMPGHEGYTGDQWLIVAGHVGDMLFNTLDLIQFICVLLAGVTLGLSLWRFKLPMKRASTIVRTCALAGAFLLVAYELFVLSPQLESELHAYWAAAASADNTGAQKHRDAFTTLHPQATRVLVATIISVLIALIASACSLTNRTDP